MKIEHRVPIVVLISFEFCIVWSIRFLEIPSGKSELVPEIYDEREAFPITPEMWNIIFSSADNGKEEDEEEDDDEDEEEEEKNF